MKTLTFDELKDELNQLQCLVDAQIQNNTRTYYFHRLKVIESLNPDICGVGLNHTFQKQFGVNRSRFHDSEDVCIDFRRNEFIVARKREDSITVVCKTFICDLRF